MTPISVPHFPSACNHFCLITTSFCYLRSLYCIVSLHLYSASRSAHQRRPSGLKTREVVGLGLKTGVSEVLKVQEMEARCTELRASFKKKI